MGDTDTKPRPCQGRIVSIDDVLPDTRIIRVKLDNKQRLNFQAGQYARLSFPGIEARPFSIASAPGQPYLEFHIRNTGRGVGAHVAEELKPGSEILIEAPFGTSHWRPSSRPLLALAGGLGIAPIKAILETHLKDVRHSPAHLYWGARDESQLYLDLFFRDLAKKNPRFSYIPVLSHDAGNSRFRTGFLGPALTEDHPSLEGFSIYMAGPPPMIEATLPLLLQKEAEKDFIFSDAWSP